MIRKQIYIEPRQDKALKKLAKKRGVSEAEFIRQALEAQLEAVAREQERMAAWAKIDESSRRLTAEGPVPGGRNWKREDLYDRPARWNK